MIRVKVLTVALLSLTLVLACGGQKIDKEQASKELREHVKKFETYLNEERAAEYILLFAEDAVITNPKEETTEGKKEITEWAQSAFMTYDFVAEFESDEMLIYPAGQRAFDKGVYHLARTPKAGGDTLKESGWYRLFWLRQNDGTWKIHRLNWLNAPATSDDPDFYK
jgi:ketosteroid isomerase-like protein